MAHGVGSDDVLVASRPNGVVLATIAKLDINPKLISAWVTMYVPVKVVESESPTSIAAIVPPDTSVLSSLIKILIKVVFSVLRTTKVYFNWFPTSIIPSHFRL